MGNEEDKNEVNKKCDHQPVLPESITISYPFIVYHFFAYL
jgi:hypothetical protein